MTALAAAEEGNAISGVSQFATNAAVKLLQGKAASEVKRLADGMQSESARAALHVIVGCAGAAASQQGCGAGALGAATSSVLGSLLGPTTGMAEADKESQTKLVSSLVGAVAAVTGSGAVGALQSAQTEGQFNHQLNSQEREWIAKSAGVNLEAGERMTKAACLAVKCWAQYKPGSVDYNRNYVSQAEAENLQPELAWVKKQKEAGFFVHTPPQKIMDAVRSDPLGVGGDVGKIAFRFLTTKVGFDICFTTGVGCTTGGGGMIVF